MAKLINLSIDVTKITKKKLIDGKKGKYLNLTVALNDAPDNYGNDVSCWEKCEKEEAKNYLGNGRVFWTDEKKVNDIQVNEPKTVVDDDPLPF